MRQHDEKTGQDHPEVVRSEPVPVPGADGGTGHRDGGHAEPLPGDALDERGSYDRDATGPDGRERPEFHPPAPLPTAFGATTVGGAVAASAMASGRPADERDPRGEDTARPGDGATDRPDRVGAEADPRAGHPVPDLNRQPGDYADPDATARFDTTTHDPDATARYDTTTHDPDATTRFDAPSSPAVRHTAPVEDSPGYGSAGPAMVDPDTAAPTATTGLTPGAVPAEPVTGLFAAESNQEFRNRWREVQLRFVDDPRAAAGEAQQVVEDAIEAVARSLAARKDELGGWQRQGSDDDTEQLRVVVRRYRDFLDRLLGL